MTKTRHRISWQMSLNQCADRRSKPEPIGGSVSRNQEPDKRILIRAHVYSWGGYGQMAEHLGRALERLGYPVAYDPLMVAEEFGAAQPFIVDRLVFGAEDRNEVVLSLPTTTPSPGRRSLYYTMFETTRVSAPVLANLSMAKAVVVPSRFHQIVLDAAGLGRPVFVAPLGLDERYEATEMRMDGPTVFGTAARHKHGGTRKNTLDMARAFVEAFPGSEDVEFRVKCFPDCGDVIDKLPRDPRIKVLRAPLTDDEMVRWTQDLTCGVYCTRGEGWGLHIHQAMGCGRPVITCLGTAMSDYVTERCCYPVDYRWVPSGDFYDGVGLWMDPDFDQMASAMRRVHRDRNEAKQKGVYAAYRAREFTWKRCAESLVHAMRCAGVFPEGLDCDRTMRRIAG